MNKVTAVLTMLPPSANKMYVNTSRGPRVSAAAKKFKHAAKVELLKQWAFAPKFDPDKPHRLTLVFYLEALYNKSWPKQAQRRYKRKDASNLIKVLEDVIAQAIGIDDSSTIELRVRKNEDPESPRVEICLEEITDE